MALLKKYFWIENICNNFKIHWDTFMKTLYLKGYKWLLTQNQRVKNEFNGYRRY